MERERRISEYWLSLNAAHASPKLDVVVLSTKYGAYTWSVSCPIMGPPGCWWCLPCLSVRMQSASPDSVVVYVSGAWVDG